MRHGRRFDGRHGREFDRHFLARTRRKRVRPARHGEREAELAREIAGLAVQNGAGRGEQDDALRVRHGVAAQQVHASRTMLPRRPRALLEQALQLLVHCVQVAVRVVVEDHDVGAEPLEPPVLLGTQDLQYERHVLGANRAHHENRQVARNAERPEPRLTQRVAREHRAGRTQRSVGPQGVRGEAFMEPRLIGRDPEMTQPHRGLAPGERDRALRSGRVVVLFGQRDRSCARGGGAGRERQSYATLRCDAHAAAQAQHRVEHRSVRARERAAVERTGVLRCAAPAHEAHAVGFPFDRAVHAVLGADHVHRPGRKLVGGARPPAAQQCRAFRKVFGLEEQLEERRVREIVGGGPEHDLDQARDLDLAQAVAAVDQRDAADLDVVLGRHDDLEPRLDAVVRALEHGLVGVERDAVALGLAAHGLVGCRPQQSAPHVAQVHELAAGVRRGIVALARDGEPAPAARAAAAVRDHRGVLPVREEVGARVERVRRAEAQRRDGVHGGFDSRGLGRTRPDDRHELRHALLQQRLGRLHAGVRVEATHHRRSEHGAGDREEAHALVMREPRPHGVEAHRVRHGLAFGVERDARRVVERLDEAVRPGRGLAREPAEVRGRRAGIHDRGQGRRIRSDHEVLGESPLEPRARNAECLVLVRAVRVLHVEGRLRDAPRHTVPAAVDDLGTHQLAARVLDQRLGVTAQQQHRHHVLEHRAAPRHQSGAAFHARQRAREPEPVLLRHLVAGDGDEAGQPGLRGEKVVVRRVEPSGPVRVGEAEPDREETARRVVEELPPHAVGERADRAGLRPPVNRASPRARPRAVAPTRQSFRRRRPAAPPPSRSRAPHATGRRSGARDRAGRRPARPWRAARAVRRVP